MKSVVATAGLIAVAHAYQPLNFNRRRSNETEVVSEGLTTLTVDVTEIATVTSCAPTITDCPAASSTLAPEELITAIVTNTIRLTETVCPISEVESISSSVIGEHETGDLPGSTITPAPTGPVVSIPLSTGVPPETTSAALPGAGEEEEDVEAPEASEVPEVGEGEGEGEDEDEDEDKEVETPAPEEETEEIVTEVEDIETIETKTVTQGEGETASVVESIVTATTQTTVIKTITACPGGCEGEDEAEVTGAIPGEGEGDAEITGSVPDSGEGEAEITGAIPGSGSSEGEAEPTTTTTATTTGTTTVTVQPEETSAALPEGGSPGAGEGSDEEETSDDESDEAEGGSTVPGTCPESGEVCSCPSAVTVTAPASTVYVTIGEGSAAPTAAPETGKNDVEDDEDDLDLDDEDDEDEDLDEDEDEDEDDCPVDEETSTVEPIPVPSNGTIPNFAKATGGPSARRRNIKPQRLV